MTVEYLRDGNWAPVPNATAQHVGGNRYLVTLTDVPIYVRLNAFDGAPLRVDGKETRTVWGSQRTNDVLVLDVLV
jgi:hypothetical protein